MSAKSRTIPLVLRFRTLTTGIGPAKGSRFGRGKTRFARREYKLGDRIQDINWSSSEKKYPDEDRYVVVVNEADNPIDGMIAVDRRPNTANLPNDEGFAVHEAIINVGTIIADSIKSVGRGRVGYHDRADDEVFHRPITRATEAKKVIEKYLPHKHARASKLSLIEMIEFLGSPERKNLRHSFLFLISTTSLFLDPATSSKALLAREEAAWKNLLSKEIDVVPVLVYDPIWEGSFDVSKARKLLTFGNPEHGTLQQVRYSKRAAEKQKTYNEERLLALFKRLRGFGLDWIEITTTDADEIYESCLRWAEVRAFEIGGAKR